MNNNLRVPTHPNWELINPIEEVKHVLTPNDQVLLENAIEKMQWPERFPFPVVLQLRRIGKALVKGDVIDHYAGKTKADYGN